MNKLEVTWGDALLIWWSYIWRCVVFSMILGFILGAIGGFIVGILGRSDLSASVGGILGYLGSLPISIYMLRKILNKRFKNFSIALIPNTEEI